MRVIFLAHSFPRAPGDAAGGFLHLLARALDDIRVEVTAVVPHEEGLAARELVDGIDVVRYRYAPAAYETLAYTGRMAEDVRGSLAGKLALLGLLAAGARAAAREARAINAAIIHAHWWFPGGLSGSRAAASAQRPLVITLHGSDVRLARGIGPARSAFARLARRAAAVTAASEYLAREAAAMGEGLDIQVLPMPVDVGRFGPPATGASGRDPRRLLFVGRLSEQKGADHALRALALTPPDTTLDVIGDGPEREPLQALAESLGVAARVRWRGALPPKELPRWYCRAAALVVPSHEEGLGLVAVEAQLCETPVIAFASGGLIDVADGGRAGLLVPPGDVPGLAAAIARVRQNPDGVRPIAAAGRIRALDRHAAPRAAERYAALYRSLDAARSR